MLFWCVFLASQLTFVSSKQEKHKYMAKAVLQNIRYLAL